jgi:hypothetical protein
MKPIRFLCTVLKHLCHLVAVIGLLIVAAFLPGDGR